MASNSKNRGKKPKLSPGFLHDLYVRQGLAAKEIAERYGVSLRTVWDWCQKYGISKTNPRQDWEFCKTCGHLLTDDTVIK